MGHVKALAGLALVLALAAPASAAAPGAVLDQLDRLTALAAEDDPIPLLDAISDAIAAEPARFVKPLLTRIRGGGLPERSLAMHLWALGLTGDAAAVEPIAALYRESGSAVVQRSSLQALATLGGARAGEVLAGALRRAEDPTARFEILALLAQMQHEAVLEAGHALLALEPQQDAWQPVLVFGKLGDKGVPFLLDRIADKDLRVRTNAIHVLGMWLIAPEAGARLRAAYWTERDRGVRELMLSAVQGTTSEVGELRRFFEAVLAREAEADLQETARETLANLEGLADRAADFDRLRPAPARPFRDVWAQLYRSAGRKGDYEALSAASHADDEPALKSLRQRILQRHSNEAFQDCQKVNQIILRNRLARSVAALDAAEEPADGKTP
ncbi:MAG: HEAT repeat domain-containing protein [Candidatus Methylomirabilales bacterium]